MDEIQRAIDREVTQYTHQLINLSVAHVDKLEHAERRAANHGIGPDLLSPPFDFTHCEVYTEQDRAKAADFAKKVMEEDSNDNWKRIVLFSDGSCSIKNILCGAGVAYKICHGDHSEWKTSSAAIIGRCDTVLAELTGLNLALDIAASLLEDEKLHGSSSDVAESKKDGLSKIYILTDSFSSLQWVDKYIKKEVIVNKNKVGEFLSHPAFREMARQMGRVSTLKAELELHWIKGHSNVQGNSKADRLARNGSDWYLQQHGMPAEGMDYQIIPFPQGTDIIERPPKRDAQAMLEESVEEPEGSHGEGHDISQRPILQPKETANKAASTSDDQVIEPTAESSAKKDLVGPDEKEGLDEEEDHVPRKKPRLE